MLFCRLSTFVKEVGADYTGLGRWVWIVVGEGEHRTRFVTAYQPNSHSHPRGSRKRTGMTVWEQHQRYFMKKGEIRSPRTLWFLPLTQLLTKWWANKENVVLMTDVNENIYTGRLAK